MNHPNIEKALQAMTCMAHQQRQDILKTLREQEPCNVKDIYKAMKIEQSRCSQQLSLLRKAGVTNQKRMGKAIYKQVNEQQVARLQRLAQRLSIFYNKPIKGKKFFGFGIYRKATLLLRCLANPSKQKVIRLLSEEGALCVMQICIRLRIEQSVVSQHLAMLKNCSLLTSERKGKFIRYQINQPVLSAIYEQIEQIF